MTGLVKGTMASTTATGAATSPARTWWAQCSYGGGKTNVSSSIMNKVPRPLLYLVVILSEHGYGLMLVIFVFSHEASSERGDDEFNYWLDGQKFIVYLHVEKMSMAVVDGKMVVFIQIGILIRGLFIWNGDPRWWDLWLF
ncbi:hypothetical protein EJB05_49644, partial [Eragrostis curvula]